MSEEQEIQMMKNTTFELPMERLSDGSVPKGPPIPSFTLSLKEVTKYGTKISIGDRVNLNEEFDYLEIKLTIGGDDPRIKAFDIYTQYSGIQTILIKHAPKNIWPLGIRFYGGFPNWDSLKDRILTVGQVVPTKMSQPANYVSATGLRAKSWTLEGSKDGELTVGMYRGKSNEGGKTGSYFDLEAGHLSLDLGHTLEFDPEDMTSGCALESHNPICSYEYTWKDYHPIPFASYNVWARIDADLGQGGVQRPYGVAFIHYQPEWLKAGTIIGRSGSGPFGYEIRCVRSDGKKITSELVTISGVLMKYEIGRWVLLSKQEADTWHIIPTSQLYWENAVDYFREASGL